MSENRKIYRTLAMACLISLFVLATANAQSAFDKIWAGVDNNLRLNAPDDNLRRILADAKLKAANPTLNGISMLYSLADGNEAQVTVKMTTRG